MGPRQLTARKYIVRGMVQGVGYRFFAVRAAARHQVKGYVKNLPGGAVEVFAQGFLEQLDQFKNELETGPSMAEVSDVEEIVLEPLPRYKSFLVDY